MEQQAVKEEEKPSTLHLQKIRRLSWAELRAIYLKILSLLWHHELGNPFHVQPCKKTYPQYYRIIDKPIALVDIRNKINRKQYKNPMRFKEDVELMFHNCQQFNADGSDIFRYSQILEKLALEQFEKERLHNVELVEQVKEEAQEEQNRAYRTIESSPEEDGEKIEKSNLAEQKLKESNQKIAEIIEKTKKTPKREKFTRSLPRKVFEKLAAELQECSRYKLVQVLSWFSQKRPELLEVETDDVIHIRADGILRADVKAIQRLFKFKIL